MSDEWFSQKLAPDGSFEDGCHPEEAEALKKYLRGESSAAEAAFVITRPVESAPNSDNDRAILWALIADALVELPESHMTNLIQLLRSIQQLPEPDSRDEPPPEHGSQWQELFGFGHLWVDLHKPNDWRSVLPQNDPEGREQLRLQHIKKAKIESQFVTNDLGGIGLDWGYECIVDALEYSDALIEFEVPAASEWIGAAGRRIDLGALNREGSYALRRIHDHWKGWEHDLWKGEEVMSLERWSNWEKRLQELAEKDVRVRDVANSMRKAMVETADGKEAA